MRSDRGQGTPHRHGGLIPGLIVAIVGVAFLLNNLNIVPFGEIWRFWPLALIAVGAVKLIDSVDPGTRTRGAIMVAAGALFQALNLGVIPGSVGQLWPLILIAVGVLLIVNRGGPLLGLGERIRAGEAFARADAVTIFGGIKRQVTSEDFRGATYVAIFGGGEIDLRRAGIVADEAVVDITAIFGGFEIRVPSNWIVVNEVVGIFGGTSDETLAPVPEKPGTRRLVVRGSAVFGGVGIKN
ncbi:MAG: hypothetical protein KGN36_07035 [Acidobacteriota bacterium]|nr:hypothetical protein [Acidobacteriota bacterium]